MKERKNFKRTLGSTRIEFEDIEKHNSITSVSIQREINHRNVLIN